MRREKATNNQIKELSALKQKKNRDTQGLILVEAKHPIEEAYRAGLSLHSLLVQKDTVGDTLPQINAPTALEVDEAAMARLSTTDSPPPCLAIFEAPPTVSQVQGTLVLVLDELQDPGNLGTLIRSAVAFGVSSIILAGQSVEPYNPKVIRASAGLVFAVPILQITKDSLQALLPGPNWTIYTTTGQAQAQPYQQADFTKPCAIVLGNEGRGVSKELLEGYSVQAITIPMTDRVESLNVAVSGSIIMAEASAQRR